VSPVPLCMEWSAPLTIAENLFRGLIYARQWRHRQRRRSFISWCYDLARTRKNCALGTGNTIYSYIMTPPPSSYLVDSLSSAYVVNVTFWRTSSDDNVIYEQPLIESLSMIIYYGMRYWLKNRAGLHAGYPLCIIPQVNTASSHLLFHFVYSQLKIVCIFVLLFVLVLCTIVP